MVASARLAAGLTGLRNRNTRVTNKTQLHIVKGSIEADPIILDDDDDEKNRILASQGVDEEDANEHHLQAALFASSQRTLSTASFKAKTPSATDQNAFIPTPDAAGLVAEFNDLYPSKRYKDPVTHLRFSDSIDESCVGGLAGSFTYFLDEHDAEWLAKRNGAAKGEGTSTSGSGTTVNGSHIMNAAPPRDMHHISHASGAKAKGKEPEHPPLSGTQPDIVFDEGHFELIMGLFEKWTDEIVSPYLHLDLQPDHFPKFDNYQNYFAEPLSPSVFANFEVPTDIPYPAKMVQLAQAIYPWWRERRMQRNGQRLVPQLHVLILETQEKEDKAGGLPYTCFRKRDVKPIRKTRTNTVAHTDRLIRLRGELQSSLELIQMVVQREKLKRESAHVTVDIWRSRATMAEYMKRLNGMAPGSIPPTDELLLIDKERKSRKPKVDTIGPGRVVLWANRKSSNVRGTFTDTLDPHSPLMLNGDTSHAFEECQKWPAAHSAGIQREVERELLKSRKDDVFWEDIVDMPYQPQPSPTPERHFRPFSSVATIFATTNDEGLASSSASRASRSLRLRTGRGGRLHLDRRLHVTKPHRLLQREWAGYPPRAEDSIAAQLHAERWAGRSWRPKDTRVQLGRKERELGQDYWAHRSLFEDLDSTASRVKNVGGIGDNHEKNISTFGFEQSVTGDAGHELWARAKAAQGEDGWKPTPHLAVDPETLGVEVAARNAAERERIVEAWRGNTIESSGFDGALALFTDGGDMAEPSNDLDEDSGWRPCDGDKVSQDERTADTMDLAWRLDERWRYDSESHHTDDRFLLDDYQPKFLRTTITLLDAQDHELIKPDPQYLVPPAPKQNRYLDHQLRLQHPGLPQFSSSVTPPSSAPTSAPLHVTPTLSVSPPSPVPNIASVPSQTLPLEHKTSQSGTNNPLTNGKISTGSTPNGTSGWPRPNGATGPGAVRPLPAPASNVRVNGTPICTKQTNGTSLLRPGLSTTLAKGVGNRNEATLNGGFPAKGYPSLKATLVQPTLDQTIATRQDPQVQQSGRPSYQLSIPSMNGVNGNEHAAINMSLGVGNLQLKVPVQRKISVRTNSVEENHTHTSHSEASPPKLTSESYSLSHPQHFSVPQLPTAGTHTA